MTPTCLLLNADAAPVSILPLSILTWEESIKYLVSEKATVLEWYHDRVVHSARWSTPIPAVMMLKEFQKKKTDVRYTKHNVFLRDNYECAYCGVVLNKRNATLDHVIPQSQGGKSTWENSVCACGPCNSAKGNSNKFKPRFKPWKPNYYQLAEKRKQIGWDLPHQAWSYYLM